jgi:hypothetical protein
MEILNYTEKSFVLFGEKTKEAKEQLKQLGGRFNPNLTHPETKEKLSAWVFSKKALESVQNFIKNGQVENDTMKKKFSHKQIDELVDPISRLGLKDNGPDPVKKTRKGSKINPTKEITRVLVPCSALSSSPCSAPCSDPGKEEYSNFSIEIGNLDSGITPEIVHIPSFQMIVPQIHMKVQLKDKDNNESIFQITKTFPDENGYIFEFQAMNLETQENIDFVMVGRKWRIASTLTPIWMNLVK